MWRAGFLWLGVAVAAAYGLVCLAFYVWQEKFVYFPGGAPSSTPASRGLAFRELALTARDGTRVHGWLIPAESSAGARRGALLLCHGNAGSIDARIGYAELFARSGFDVLLFDYRGYGASEGEPTEEGTYLDAEAAHEHLVEREGVAPRSIVVFGESLGGAVAVELARRRPIAGLILENSFASIPAMGARIYPWLPVRWIARVRYDSVAKIGTIRVPLLAIHTPHDDIVPFEQGRALFDAAREPKRFLETEGPHNGGGFLRRREWIEEVLAFATDAVRE